MSISKLAIVAAVTTLAALSQACMKSPDRREVTPNRITHMSVLFNHQMHYPAMKEMGLDCLSCHAEKKALSGIWKAKEPGRRFECHDCHRNPSFVTAASERCDLCHSDLQPVLPADHQLDWTSRHATFARLDAFQCATCHSQASCTNCHLQRDSIQQTVHPRTFQYTHSVQARMSPHTCGSCHQKTFCSDCHAGKGVTF